MRAWSVYRFSFPPFPLTSMLFLRYLSCALMPSFVLIELILLPFRLLLLLLSLLFRHPLLPLLLLLLLLLLHSSPPPLRHGDRQRRQQATAQVPHRQHPSP